MMMFFFFGVLISLLMVMCDHVAINYHFGKSLVLKMKALHVWGANY